MKRSLINTLVLAGVFAITLGWYLVYEKKVSPKQTEATEKAKQLVTLGKDDIQEFSFARLRPGTESAKEPKYDTIKLKKTGNNWEIVEPIQDMADTFAIPTMISTIVTTKNERIVDENAKDLEQYGLKTPSIKVSVKKDTASPAEEFYLGKKTPVGSSVYAKVATGNTVLKMPQVISSILEKDLKGIRAKNFVTLNRYELGEVVLSSKFGETLLTRDDKDVWQLSRENVPADTNETNKMLNAIVDLKAVDFASDDAKKDMAKFGLIPPAIKISLTKFKDPKTKLGLLVGKIGDKFYAKREDKNIVYQIDKEFLPKVLREPSAFRSQDIATFNRFDVKHVKWDRGADSLDLVKEPTGWKVTGDPNAKLDDTKVDNYLAKLQQIRIEKYLTEKDKKLTTAPKLLLHLFEKSAAAPTEAEKVTLKFGATQNKQVAVERTGLDLPYLIKEEDFKQVNLSKADLLKAPDSKSDDPKTDNKTPAGTPKSSKGAKDPATQKNEKS